MSMGMGKNMDMDMDMEGAILPVLSSLYLLHRHRHSLLGENRGPGGVLGGSSSTRVLALLRLSHDFKLHGGRFGMGNMLALPAILIVGWMKQATIHATPPCNAPDNTISPMSPIFHAFSQTFHAVLFSRRTLHTPEITLHNLEGIAYHRRQNRPLYTPQPAV
ncbi:hypothetical protein BGZ63DRAFT_401711 [Mariannaea sp. PMI_226]|nr:hypothetical protein BGZ63DRAFT_401711 [Mariannaea sp. PMI_226]